MARPVLHFYDPAFVELYDRTTRLLQEVFRTRHDVVIMHGEGMLGFTLHRRDESQEGSFLHALGDDRRDLRLTLGKGAGLIRTDVGH